MSKNDILTETDPKGLGLTLAPTPTGRMLLHILITSSQ
ncbi:hypothetical protein VV93_v1c37890 [Vibrio vulnificus]|nr:hypothetical protein VV93_v1c15460 [Vibrio vulnificus]AIL72845.1 hypothetical protein VV93_v1c37890 [Vibrio vulnificus]